MIGVYAIVHRETGRRYIGSSKHIERRWDEHTRTLSRGTHHSPFLQHTWAKYGPEAFDFVVVEVCATSELRTREQIWLDWARAADGIHGFNMSSSTATGWASKRAQRASALARTGAKRGPLSAEHRQKISKARTGRVFGPRDPSVGAKIASALRGQPFTEERKAKISASNTGRPKGPQSELHKERIRQASLRHRHSPESLAKIKAHHWSRSENAADVIAKSRMTKEMARANIAPPKEDEVVVKH